MTGSFRKSEVAATMTFVDHYITNQSDHFYSLFYSHFYRIAKMWFKEAQVASFKHCQTSLPCLLLGPPPPRQWPAPWLLNTLTLLLLSFVFLLSVEVGGQLNPRLNIVFCFIGQFPTIFLSRPLNFASMHRYNARIQADRCRQLSIVFTQDNK